MNKNKRRRDPRKTRLEWEQRIHELIGRLIELYRAYHIKHLLRSWITLLVILCIIGSIGYYVASVVGKQAVTHTIQTVRFESEGYIDQSEALALLGLTAQSSVASIDSAKLNERLKNHPCIKQGSFSLELPDTIHIQIVERLPLCYVEEQQAVLRGTRVRHFVCEDGYIIPNIEAFYRAFHNAPTWYVKPSDYERFEVGARIKPDSIKPVLETLTAVNVYELKDLPPVREILRPKAWKTQLILETGTEVTMNVFDIKEQVERLVKILQHARVNRREVRSINVIPKINPSVIYADEPKSPASAQEKP